MGEADYQGFSSMELVGLEPTTSCMPWLMRADLLHAWRSLWIKKTLHNGRLARGTVIGDDAACLA